MISLVVPVFNEEALIDTLHDRIVRVMEPIGHPWQVVYVNDGSADRSLTRLLAHQTVDDRVVVLNLSRNWGHQSALTAGLRAAHGDAVVLMDGDLQDPPEVIADLVAAWEQGARVVVAERRTRAERGLRGRLFPLFYKVLHLLSDYPIPLNAGIFGLLDRQALDALNRLPESNRYLPGLRSWIGFPSTVVYYDRAERLAGDSKQSIWRLLKYGLDAIFSFSYKPLRLSLLLGTAVAAVTMLCAVLFIGAWLLNIGLFGNPVIAGYTTTIVSVLFLGGVQLFCIGLLGEYIGRIYDEVKRRPLFLVDRAFGGEPVRWIDGMPVAAEPRPPLQGVEAPAFRSGAAAS